MLALTGCVTQKPYDYTNFPAAPAAFDPRAAADQPKHRRQGHLQLPFHRHTSPCGNGLLRFPVAEVDALMKENGLPTAYEMQRLRSTKSGRSSALIPFFTLRSGNMAPSMKSFPASPRLPTPELVDVKTLTLWEGTTVAQQSSGDSGGSIIGALITAAVTQVVNSATDPAHDVSSMANYQLFTPKDHGLIYGPYFPKDKAQ